MSKKRCTAVVLAAGSGSRMKSTVAKQYMLIDGKPLIWYALHTVQESRIIDDCILVTGENDISYMQQEIVERFGFTKVEAVIAGGAERYLSVAKAMEFIASAGLQTPNEDGFVFIHDGARPFLSEQILCDTYRATEQYHACVAAVPSKDTIKIADTDGFVSQTPDRRTVWSIQTPQVFSTKLIVEAYAKLIEELPNMNKKGITVTDDASVVELFTDHKVKLVEASYTNIKITTPEDIATAESFLRKA